MVQVSQNDHYTKTMQMMNSGKDSIFEPCKITHVDTKRNMATVYGTVSKQTREDVPILFPSLFMNTGVIAFPSNDSTGLLLWGQDKQAFLLPAQFIIPTMNASGNKVHPDASPGQFDKVYSLENMEAGEILLKALGGCYVMLRNVGEIALSTPKLHKVTLAEKDGRLETVVERTSANISGFKMYNGPKGNDHHITFEIDDQAPKWETGEVLTKDMIMELINSEGDLAAMIGYAERIPNVKAQFMNVYDETDRKKKSDLDNSDLLGEIEIRENGVLQSRMQLSKEGSFSYRFGDNYNDTVAGIQRARWIFYSSWKNRGNRRTSLLFRCS